MSISLKLIFIGMLVWLTYQIILKQPLFSKIKQTQKPHPWKTKQYPQEKSAGQ